MPESHGRFLAKQQTTDVIFATHLVLQEKSWRQNPELYIGFGIISRPNLSLRLPEYDYDFIFLSKLFPGCRVKENHKSIHHLFILYSSILGSINRSNCEWCRGNLLTYKDCSSIGNISCNHLHPSIIRCGLKDLQRGGGNYLRAMTILNDRYPNHHLIAVATFSLVLRKAWR